MILRIQLKNGLYDFFNVPENIYTGLLNAHSKRIITILILKILTATPKYKLNQNKKKGGGPPFFLKSFHNSAIFCSFYLFHHMLEFVFKRRSAFYHVQLISHE